MVQWAEMIGQCVMWSISATMIIVLLPWFLLFWTWKALSDYSGSLKGIKHRPDPSRPYLYNSCSKFIQLKDVSIHYVEGGDPSRPLIVCLHGFPESWFSWRHQLREFASTHWIVAMDMRGYGESDKPRGREAYKMEKLVDDVHQLIHKLGRKECVLLAHDWGGAVGWQFAYKYPEMITKFVPMNCPHPAAFEATIRSDLSQLFNSWYMFFFQLPVIPEVLLTAFGSSLFYFAIHQGREDVIGAENIQVYMDLYRRPNDLTGPINYYRNIVSEVLSPIRPESIRLRVPTMLIWGRNDTALKASMAPLSAKWVDGINFSLQMIDGATHWVQQDEPELVNQCIRRFICS